MAEQHSTVILTGSGVNAKAAVKVLNVAIAAHEQDGWFTDNRSLRIEIAAKGCVVIVAAWRRDQVQGVEPPQVRAH